VKLEDLSLKEREQLKREALAELLAETGRDPLTITDIRQMSESEYLARKPEVDRFLENWDGTEPEPAEGDEPPKPSALEQYRAELARLPQREAQERANADWESGKLQSMMQGRSEGDAA
jgi:hypothetical protein